MNLSSDTEQAVITAQAHKDRGRSSEPRAKTNSKSNRRTFSRFVQRLVGFFKEIWKSLLILVFIGAVTGGVRYVGCQISHD